ncbi:RagB/SusD family nutrient uptake outer membrane protein [Dysgonomonas sp. 25]|uniref:RagB/SusD family nutrient uptake outer membrane protein n=1 Tax=Dysgonomonas sp. 25 TaxID=2302933 RepID=UPI0013D35BA0|nr:RagB/SusD family nutrient uptake outer membrane protein [Dysgonomonas sp. 25]NDV69383.1 RagB/SusD family nutrient uptake outer membrane protein [Dysgonomonas sp. 25]
MRKISFKNILLSAVVLLAFSACNNLDQAPKDKFTDANFWQSVKNSDLMVNMAYRQMYGADKMWKDEALSDNVFNGRSWEDTRRVRAGLADASLDMFKGEWKDMYGGIKTCHKYLDNVDRVPDMDDAYKAKRTSEVRFIRAWNYFRLVSFYGDVPFFTTDISLADAKTISRTPKATVLQFIHDELDEIMPLLPTRDQLAASDNGRVTRGAACAFQARVYLYESNWAKVEDYAGRLINDQANYGTYALYPDYEGLFQSLNEYNEEVIFDYAFVPAVKTWGEMYARVPMSQGAYLNDGAPTQELVDSYIMKNGKTIADASYNPNMPYVNRDPRLDYSIVYHDCNWIKEDGSSVVIKIDPNDASTGSSPDKWGVGNSTSTGYYIRKYWDPDHEASIQQSTNIILLRYADILLMYAEAMFEQNRMSSAVWDATIKLVRQRAGFTATGAVDYPTLGTDDMRALIRNERRSELAMEGVRYHDVVRWKAGLEFFDKPVRGAKFANGGTAHIIFDERKFNTNRDYLWAVPLDQVDLNPNLKPNNPGY